MNAARLILPCFALVLFALLSACSGKQTDIGAPVPAALDLAATTLHAAGLPFPEDRAASGAMSPMVLGNAAEQRSSGAYESGTALVLDGRAGAGGPGKLQYAVYRIASSGVADHVDIMLAPPAETTTVYLALANYSRQAWDLIKITVTPVNDEPTAIQLDPERHLSTLGNAFIAVLAPIGAWAQVNSLLFAGWQVAGPNPASSGSVGVFPSLHVVNGQPAIAYLDYGNSRLMYVRATDIDGAVWGTPQILDSPGYMGWYPSLKVVNGHPAISYLDYSGKQLKYIRAADLNGATWGVPQVLAGAYAPSYNSLVVVGGNPAISFCSTSVDLQYIRSVDAIGAAWGPVQTLDGVGSVGLFNSMALIRNNPAIAYFDATKGDLKYICAADTTGSAWATPLAVDSTGVVGGYPSLALVAGVPAISYEDSTNRDLKYVRASDTFGTTWHPSQTIDSAGDVGRYSSLAIVGGNPAVGYYHNASFNLKYIRATDAAGTSWGVAQTLDSPGMVGRSPSLAVVNYSPAIAYWDETNSNLKYIRLY